MHFARRSRDPRASLASSIFEGRVLNSLRRGEIIGRLAFWVPSHLRRSEVPPGGSDSSEAFAQDPLPASRAIYPRSLRNSREIREAQRCLARRVSRAYADVPSKKRNAGAKRSKKKGRRRRTHENAGRRKETRRRRAEERWVPTCVSSRRFVHSEEPYAPRAKIRTGLAAITRGQRETVIFIIRGHLNTAVPRGERDSRIDEAEVVEDRGTRGWNKDENIRITCWHEGEG